MLMHAFNITVGVIGICSTILILFALITKCITQRQKEMMKPKLSNLSSNPRDSPIYRWRVALDHLTNLFILSCLIHAASVSLIRFNIYPSTELFCSWITRCNVSIYHINRCTLYSILLIRIHIGFNNSMYSYSFKYIIAPLFSIICAGWLTAMFLNTIHGVVHGEYNQFYQTCSPIFQSWAVVLSGGFDIILSSILLILFIRPLINLNRAMKIDRIIEQVSIRQLTIDINNNHNKCNEYEIDQISKPISSSKIEISTKCQHSIHNISKHEEINNITPYSVDHSSMNINNLSAINIKATQIQTANKSISSTFGTTPDSVGTPSDHDLEIIVREISDIEEEEIIIDENKEIEFDEHQDIMEMPEVPEWKWNAQNSSYTATIETNHTDQDTDEYGVDYEAKKNKYDKGSSLTIYQKKLDNVYEELITRYALLVIIAIGSSFLMYLGVFIWGHWIADLSPIDDAINVWCIILISKKTNKVYHKLCCSCNWLMRKCCIFRMNVGINSKVIEDTYHSNNSCVPSMTSTAVGIR